MTSTPATFYAVNFGPRTGNTFNLQARGEIWLDEERLLIRGRTAFQFSFMKMKEHAVAIGDIANVFRQGRNVRMSTSARQAMASLRSSIAERISAAFFKASKPSKRRPTRLLHRPARACEMSESRNFS